MSKKIYTQGYIVPMILAIILVLIIAGGVYFSRTKKAEAPVLSLTPTPSPLLPTETTTPISTGVENPVITSISPSSGPIGTAVLLRGKGFSGFEGDKYAWIENSKGEKGIIYGNRETATDELISFTLENKYCTADTSYSGNPCPSYITIVPGSYTIYVYPWGVSSNKVTFTVLK